MKQHNSTVLAEKYHSPFSKWNLSSWIRSKPMRRDSFAGLPFSPELVPLAAHVSISANDRHWTTLLAYRLLAHLRFTTSLELDYINPVCNAISQGRIPLELSNQQKKDALRIYCDEGGHALFVEELACELKQHFAIDDRILKRPKFTQVLEQIIEKYQGKLSPALIQLFFVTISETLITTTLSHIPRDLRVATIVRSVIADHAADEALHSLYFREFFPLLWHSLSLSDKELVGQILPELILAFLSPDQELEEAILVHELGFKLKNAQEALAETYLRPEVIESVKLAARPTLKVFEYAGVFTFPVVEDAFVNYQLL